MIVILPESSQIGLVKYIIIRMDRDKIGFKMRHPHVKDSKFPK